MLNISALPCFRIITSTIWCVAECSGAAIYPGKYLNIYHNWQNCRECKNNSI